MTAFGRPEGQKKEKFEINISEGWPNLDMLLGTWETELFQTLQGFCLACISNLGGKIDTYHISSPISLQATILSNFPLQHSTISGPKSAAKRMYKKFGIPDSLILSKVIT